MFGRSLRAGLVLATALTATSAPAGDAAAPGTPDAALEQQFRDPRASARPRVWWHWMNGNISKDGIAKDLAWMKRVGIGGLQTFDIDLQTPQIVDKRLVYMTPEWKDAFRFAASEADRLGLELAIASSPGFSETGGPWVPPADALKKLVWSETEVSGGRPFAGKLAPLPTISGPFQTMAASDPTAMAGGHAPAAPTASGEVAVLAFPLAGLASPPPPPQARSGSGTAIDTATLFDADLDSGVNVERRPADGPGSLVLSYPAPQTIRSATLLIPNPVASLIGATVAPRLEASDDGTSWRKIAEIPQGSVPGTVSFAPVTAKHFRLVLDPPAEPTASENRGGAPGAAGDDPRAMIRSRLGRAPVRITDFRLSPEARVDRFETKAAFSLTPDYLALSAGADEPGVAPSQVIDLTRRLRADGTLDWTPPKGRWRVLRLGWSLTGKTNHPAPLEATGLEVDKFDAAAVRRYLEHYLGLYREASGGLIGERGVRALLTDSTEIGAANWTPRMIEQFRRLRGYDPTPWLPTLAGTVIGSPDQSDRFLYDFRRTLADLHASEAGLRAIGTAPDFRHGGGRPDSEILFVHRQLADGDSYFLSNRQDRAEIVEARFRVTGKAPELWHADTGMSEAVSYRIEGGETVVPLTLHPDGSVHVVFRKPAGADALAIKKVVPVEVARLDGAWNLAFQPGRGAPAKATFAPLDQSPDAAIKYFSGTATYTRAFAAPRGWKPGQALWLDLGEVREIAEV